MNLTKKLFPISSLILYIGRILKKTLSSFKISVQAIAAIAMFPIFSFACQDCVNHLTHRIPPRTHRHSTFAKALNLFQERHAKIIVETGTARCGERNCLGDGCSTVLFFQWVKNHGGKVYSVDIDQTAIDMARESLGTSEQFLDLVCSDSVKFLRNFNQPIDLLYLDSYDFEVQDPIPSQQHHLMEIKSAEPWLTNDSIVMIDDCNLPYGGKGALAIEYLLGRGWKVIAYEYQVILVKSPIDK